MCHLNRYNTKENIINTVTGKDGYKGGAWGAVAPPPEEIKLFYSGARKNFLGRNPRTPNFRRFVCLSTSSLFSAPPQTFPVSATGNRADTGK